MQSKIKQEETNMKRKYLSLKEIQNEEKEMLKELDIFLKKII